MEHGPCIGVSDGRVRHASKGGGTLILVIKPSFNRSKYSAMGVTRIFYSIILCVMREEEVKMASIGRFDMPCSWWCTCIDFRGGGGKECQMDDRKGREGGEGGVARI